MNIKINTPRDIAPYIDHTLLKPEATEKQFLLLCQEALIHKFASVCIPPSFVALCFKELQNSPVKSITVIGFPLGYQCTETKVFETQNAIENGAQEIDMVLPIGHLKERNLHYVENDLKKTLRAAGDIPVKVILETSLLSDQEKTLACQLSQDAGASFIKTSTGFSSSGASISDIKLIRKTILPHIGVKASGGIKTYQDALDMIAAGANRLGTSSGVTIVTHMDTKRT